MELSRCGAGENAAMAEQALLEPEPAVVPTDSKWIAGISSDEPVCEAASRVLDARLKAVCQSLPLAAARRLVSPPDSPVK